MTKIKQILKPTKLGVSWGTPKRHAMIEKFEGTFSKEDIRKYAQEKSNALKKSGYNGMILVSVKYPALGLFNGGFRNGHWTEVGHDVSLYSLYDGNEEPNFTRFDLYYIKNAPAVMGADDENNDCVYNCLKARLKRKMPWKTPAEFKLYIGLSRKAPVEFSSIPLIDNLIRDYRVNVTGDYVYTSTKKASLEINLQMIDGHCTLAEVNKLKVTGVSYQEKTILMYTYDKPKQIATCYDGTNTFTKTRQEIYNMLEDFVNQEYVLVQVDKKVASEEDFNLEEHYKSYIDSANIMKKETQGLVNMFKTGTYKRTALNLFEYFNQHTNPDDIRQDEATWIQKAKSGPLIYGTQYTGEAYKGDFVSMYPSTMANKQGKFPIKRGVFSKITKEEFTKGILPYGIYRCVISGNVDKRLFRINPQDHYTHIDIEIARRLKYTIRLIEDEKPNALTYERSSLVTGHQLFGDFVKIMFGFKNRKIPHAKDILTILWGALCELNRMTHEFELGKTDFNVRDNQSMTDIRQLTNGQYKMSYVPNDKMFETNYARIAPFILARGRYLLSKVVTPFIEDVVFLHTDGFITKTKQNLKYGLNLGDIRYEGYNPNFWIKNAGNKSKPKTFTI